MDNVSKNKLKGTLIVPVGLALLLVPFSMLIEWNLVTAILFWFVFTPALSVYLPTLVSDNKTHLFESVVGLVIFYGIMVFMIYDHYKSDYFKLMMISCVINVIVVLVLTIKRRPRTQTE